MFNIETYLDSLPYNITKIDVSYKRLTSLDVTRFKNLKILQCSNNQLTSLHLNENLETLDCSYNNLTSLHLNENLETLDCYNNDLTTLLLNEKLETLECSDNQLTSLQLNENLRTLQCTNNHLTSLHLNKNLETLYCYCNDLTSLHLNEKLKTLYYDVNPIFEIINSDDKDIINQKLRVLNQFRYLYYCLKFKKRLRDLLWVKIREPKIRKKYSYEYLVEHLHEDTDLDEVLNNW
jgi:Leucine-rich repeat (LRR) protein